MRRLIIEYSTCCINDTDRITSTLCSFKGFNNEFNSYNLTNLMKLVNKGYPPQKERPSGRHLKLIEFLGWAVIVLCVTCSISLALWLVIRLRRNTEHQI